MSFVDDIKSGFGKGHEDSELDVEVLKHLLRTTYGWVSDEEIDKILIPRFLQMVYLCQEEKKSNINFMKMVLKGQGYKGIK